MSETIINGIDVSECPLYDKNTGCYHTFNGECVKDSCGVYKWLLKYKRLQEELDIKEKMLDKFMIGSGDILEKLEQNNKKLIEINDDIKDRYCDLYENANKLANKFHKYKQALEEIRSYCDEQNLKADYTACFITNKIDEVLDDN